jgi:aminoglycoside phosphotransferase (APT) family kinase protein
METQLGQGVRVDWFDVPGEVRAAVEDVCGSAVVEAHTQPGGFSPGAAARVRCQDGARFFVKAASSTANPHTPAMHRQEARVLQSLHAHDGRGRLPVPRLVGAVDVGTWAAVVLTDVEGRHPRLPWDAAELTQVLATVDDLAEVLTPAPAGMPTAAEELGAALRGWRSLAAGERLPDGLDDWSRRHLGELAELEATWESAAAGSTLLHCDLRADNLLLTARGPVVVDWSSACVGTPVLDLVAFAPSVALHGGPPPAHLLGGSRGGRAAPADLLRPLVCAIAGYFTHEALQPAPPGLPTVRVHQAAQGHHARAWLAEVL